MEGWVAGCGEVVPEPRDSRVVAARCSSGCGCCDVLVGVHDVAPDLLLLQLLFLESGDRDREQSNGRVKTDQTNRTRPMFGREVNKITPFPTNNRMAGLANPECMCVGHIRIVGPDTTYCQLLTSQ